MTAAGFVAYEAAPAFDAAQVVRGRDSSVPLAWMMICDSRESSPSLPPGRECVVGTLRPSVSQNAHRAAVSDIRRRIAAGDVYQVNHTCRMRGKFAGDPLALFGEFANVQRSPWMFFAETESWAVCSASPECFFLRRGNRLESRPMKGTRPPERANELTASEKERAENLMIVDMLRNDLSRIPGAQNVSAGPLLQVETHPTVAQMTSTVKCEVPDGVGGTGTGGVGVAEIFAGLFPCASVTGAPKVAAMRVIRELEDSPRGVYCGATGIAFGNEARFAVAIRTAVVDKRAGELRYGTGGGIVSDSDPDGEWNEMRIKAALFSRIPPARLIETMRAESGTVALLPRHLSRLRDSASRLGFVFDESGIRAAIENAARECERDGGKLRLLLSPDGAFILEPSESPLPSESVVAGLSAVRVFSGDELLRHKTSRRAVYDAALSDAKSRGWDDAILQNESGEITETCVANIALKVGGELLTPPMECGLLPGVLRAEMLSRGKLRESRLTSADLQQSDAVFRLNALRGMEKVVVVG